MFGPILGNLWVGRKLTILTELYKCFGIAGEMLLYVPGRIIFQSRSRVLDSTEFLAGEKDIQAQFHRSQSYDYCLSSRPDDLGTLNHRSEAKAVMDADRSKSEWNFGEFCVRRR
jgi:hypothetical protein